jgi:hypothetical protein
MHNPLLTSFDETDDQSKLPLVSGTDPDDLIPITVWQKAVARKRRGTNGVIVCY